MEFIKFGKASDLHLIWISNQFILNFNSNQFKSLLRANQILKSKPVAQKTSKSIHKSSICKSKYSNHWWFVTPLTDPHSLEINSQIPYDANLSDNLVLSSKPSRQEQVCSLLVQVLGRLSGASRSRAVLLILQAFSVLRWVDQVFASVGNKLVLACLQLNRHTTVVRRCKEVSSIGLFQMTSPAAMRKTKGCNQ